MVLAIVETDGDAPTESSLEAVTLARDVADRTDEPLEAVVFDVAGPGEGAGAGGDAGGSIGDAIADDLGEYGVGDVHVVSHDRLDAYAPEAYAAGVEAVVADRDPDAVVAPGSDRGQEVLSRVAASRGQSMAANCLAVESVDADADVGGDTVELPDADGSYALTRQRWGGTLIEEALLGGDPKLLTAAEHEVGFEPAADPADPSVHAVTPDLADEHLRVQVDRYEESDEEGVPLGEARVVVSGGRGVGGPEGYDELEELADLLGGAVGASRAAVNEGWRPHDDQVGQTGAKISPTLYIACGISGAVQHMVGCKGADTILAINTDPEAAIIQKAEYAVIADLHEVVPALNEAIRDAQ
ncbi:electron transfer flavoprotein alpha subunit apoprotein [Halopenitus malekzadehii]|uniref:Electron transfer flavoprotein alpha subunit apoprotein n=1 Tax=Halopenitus malekzadehii TaxID=1267564 RepID=A0A1H6JDX6_9EURY|nr:electron transfer flavoprotein subunit alpha/FixB family protein [Halopenitus malekzadehii]SEH57240.1 electron transfer flavoprotein alpha subunit apoprotein [Halopenitus malekzadehii]